MIKILTNILIIILSHICHSHPTITEYYDINEVNKLSLVELQRSRFELALQSNLQIDEYGLFDFSHPLNGRAVRICGLLIPRDIEVYLRILSSPVLHNPPYNLSFGNDERLMRHLGFVKGVVRLPQSGAAYKMIQRILKNHVSSLTLVKDFYKPKQTWPTYLDNRAAYTNLWKHATNLFTVKLHADRKTYYSIEGDIYVYKYYVFFDRTKFQDLALLLGYWNIDKISIPEYLVKEFENELNNVNRSNYPKDFFTKLGEFEDQLKMTGTVRKNMEEGNERFSVEEVSLREFMEEFRMPGVTAENSGAESTGVESTGAESAVSHQEDAAVKELPNAEAVDQRGSESDDNLSQSSTPEESKEKRSQSESVTKSASETESITKSPMNQQYSTTISIIDWVGGLTWEEAMTMESQRAAEVLIKILYKTTRNMMKSHNIDVDLIQKERVLLYKTTFYSYWTKKLRNLINSRRLLENRFDDVSLDEEAEEILFESGSRYKVYWNLKNDSLYNRKTVSDKSAQDIDQSLLDLLLFEPSKFYNKLINISGDAINFQQVYQILLALTQDTTQYTPKSLFSATERSAFQGEGIKNRMIVNAKSTTKSRNVTGTLNKVLEQYSSLPSNVNNILRGRAKCLMAFLYLFGVTDSKGTVGFPNGWPRDIKRSISLLIAGISSPCGLCNTLVGFLASIGFPPVSNNIYAWENRKSDDETTVYQLISGNLYSSFLKKNADAGDEKKGGRVKEKASIKMDSKKNKPEKKNKKDKSDKIDSPLIESGGVVDRSGYDLPLLCYLSGSYKNDELSSLAYSYYIHSGIGNSSRTCQNSAQSSINRSPKNVGMMCLDAIPYVIESAKSSMKNKHDQVHEASEEYKSKRYAEFIKKLSHMGDSDGLRMMGDFYYTGHEEGGIRRNYQQAINFWSRAAESGDAPSALAIAHHHLSNISTDDSGHSAMQAERYLRMVLNSSSPNSSSFSTANFYLYRHGLGQPRDPALAARYLRESADRGDVNSMVLMGHAYAGILTDVTPPEGRNIFMSFYYYRRAAQSGNIVGLFNSAVFTLHGYDLEYTNALDRCNEAYKLFSRVARMGTMATVLRVLAKRAKRNNDKIGHVLMNMMLSELGDSNAHRELTKHFKTNSVFCYTQNLDPDITSPSTLYSSKNMSNASNPITFKKFQAFQNLQKSVPLESIETLAEPTPHNSTMGNMGANTTLTGNVTNMSTVTYPDRNEVTRMSREIRMLNMVRVTEQPDDPEPDLGNTSMWTRDESQNVSIFDSLLKSTSSFKDAEDGESENGGSAERDARDASVLSKSDREAAATVDSTKRAGGADTQRRAAPDANTRTQHTDKSHSHTDATHTTDAGAPRRPSSSEGSCYYYYSRRGAYSPQNSTPLLLAEALLSGRPWLPSEALFWAKRSKESESLKGSYMYATMLEAGIGAPKNCQMAFGIFKNFMSSKSRGERILGLACILRNRIISRLRYPAFLRSFLVRLMYDSYAHSALVSRGYTPCNFEFLELDSLPPVGLHILSVLYLVMVAFALIVYVKIFSSY
ncbi:uncharacterized protein TOT_020000523 [Theileria orientalis strain Shintoku]|uniref:Uncharacterized protein n=1 Tax=Theileria orientalis strain Shintoku TaxID=869250 RepID=J4C868_THEOR|nr:uncharacterized protein TOT_020000523 [Theileria orientalis strain Shintoku]BAM40263.1 uncharacterized protein TOT_020000523 [Theileria orientalis strain Shintoku]|eukprot:XP_009690564.1 uncharacterized protein TOT_020000523 [Theileria orientalis strain Shintoku]